MFKAISAVRPGASLCDVARNIEVVAAAAKSAFCYLLLITLELRVLLLLKKLINVWEKSR